MLSIDLSIDLDVYLYLYLYHYKLSIAMTVASTAHTSISPKPSHHFAQRPPNDGDQRPPHPRWRSASAPPERWRSATALLLQPKEDSAEDGAKDSARKWQKKDIKGQNKRPTAKQKGAAGGAPNTKRQKSFKKIQKRNPECEEEERRNRS